MVVDVPKITDKPYITNDIAEFREDGSFRIVGRTDNVINSGGIKVQIEQVEQVLRPHLSGRFAITAVPHPKLGEAIILLAESSIDPINAEKAIRQFLPRHHQPLLIHTVEVIPQTGNGKIDRIATRQLAKKINLSSSTIRYIH